MKKEGRMETRGIRFSAAQWSKISKKAAEDKSGRTKPSDIVRFIVDDYFTRATRT